MIAVLPVEAVFPRRLPWHLMFIDMNRAGVAYSRQANLLGIPWGTFHDWLKPDSPEPRHSLGEAIIAMHRAVCGDELSEKRQREGVLQG